MRIYRLTIQKEDELGSESILLRNKDSIHQLIKVLRVEPGIKNPKEKISFIDNSGKIYMVDFIAAEKNQLEFKINSVTKSQRELKRKIKFFIPLIKQDAFLFMLRKLTELGVQDFYPVIFDRSQKQSIESFAKESNRKRAEKIIIEATEQCEGAIFAKLYETIKFTELKDHLATSDLKLFASERLANEDLESCFMANLPIIKQAQESETIALLIGPEGGIADKEVEELESLRFQPYSLGKRLLKAETAAISLFSSLNLY